MDDDRASTEPCRPPSTKRQKCAASGAAAKDEISEPELLQRLEKEAAALEECICTQTAELDRLRRRIASIRPGGALVDGGATVADAGEQNDVDISSLESNCLASIISYLDPQSVGRCEMTSKAMKGAAELAWPAVEEHTTSKDKDRRSGKSAKERVVLHFTASRFAREVEARVVQRNGRNKCRPYLYAHPSHLPSHGFLGKEENYAYFLRISTVNVKDAKELPLGGTDKHVLSEGFEGIYTNRYNLHYEGDLVHMNIGGLHGDQKIWPHMPNKIISYEEEFAYYPEFDEFTEFINWALVTVVALDKNSRVPYLLSATWGFEKEIGWTSGATYEFGGTWMGTSRGSEEMCRLTLRAHTGELGEGDCASVDFDVEYQCPRSEFGRMPDGNWEFGKRQSYGFYLLEEDLVDDLGRAAGFTTQNHEEDRTCW